MLLSGMYLANFWYLKYLPTYVNEFIIFSGAKPWFILVGYLIINFIFCTLLVGQNLTLFSKNQNYCWGKCPLCPTYFGAPDYFISSTRTAPDRRGLNYDMKIPPVSLSLDFFFRIKLMVQKLHLPLDTVLSKITSTPH